jgi:type IV pilus assembly protein PilY1
VNFFRAYETGGAAVGDVPISVMPVAFYDAVTKQPIWVFGTGKYLGDEDRIASNAKTQYIFGLRDYGETSTNYPIVPSKLFAKVMKDKTVNSVVAREVFTSAVPSTNLGWKLPMDQEPGERVVVTVTPLYASNVALVTSLIPNGTDPCDPKRTGFAFGLDAASGSGTEALSKSIEKNVLGGTKPDTSNFWVGVQINNPSISGNTSAQVYKGGGGIQLTGMVDGSGNPIVIPNTYWHRGAWRELLDLH